MKIKVSLHKFTSTIKVLREEVELSNTGTAAYVIHVESHLSKKQPQPTIAMAFLFSQLHFNVTSNALFHGCHLVFYNS